MITYTVATRTADGHRSIWRVEASCYQAARKIATLRQARARPKQAPCAALALIPKENS